MYRPARRLAAVLVGLVGLMLLGGNQDEPPVDRREAAASSVQVEPDRQSPDDARPEEARPDDARPEDARPEDARPEEAPPEEAAKRDAPPRAFLIPVSLPITGDEDTRVKRMVDRLVSELPERGSRPILIFELRAKKGQAGETSQFERSLSLARYLSGPRLSRVKTVAWVPDSVFGHAVLVAMACEDLVIHPDAEFGAAGISEDFPDPTMRRGYAEIANRRRTIPEAVALGMLDKELAVFRVNTLDGVRYLLGDELAEAQRTAVVGEATTVSPVGDFVRFPGDQMRELGFASHLASSRRELEAAFALPPGGIQQDPSLGEGWRAVQVELRDRVTAAHVNQILRGIQDAERRDRINLIYLRIDSPGGAPAESMRLAAALAELDGSLVRTVAYVSGEARADAVLPALACDHLVMEENAILGGPGDHHLTPEERDDLKAPIQQLASEKSRDWSLILGLLDPRLDVYRYEREGTGEERYLCPEEAESLSGWQRREELDLRRGLLASEAETYGLARTVVRNEDELWQLYNLEQSPRTLQPAWAETTLERIASQPWFARTLLFVAFFALMTEAAQPGIGVPGFISGLCFLLFFWAQFLNGSAGWLEVLLFVGGVACVAIELFVVPGFGIFGVGGGLMILGSIVLASQTFVIPRNAYQVNQLPSSLFMVVFALGGAVAALFLMRRALANSPLFSHLLLPGAEPEEREEIERRESLVSWNHLVGKRGVTTTRLNPSGKARFGDEVVDVISDGDLLDRGTAVSVVEVQGNHVLVQPIDGELLS